MPVRSGQQQDVNITSESFEQGLRRELEEGAITYNDFERTTQFAARSPHFIRVTTATGTIAAGWTVYYGRWYRKRPWSWPTTLMWTPLAFIVGMVPGLIYRINCARRFQEGLDDQKGLTEALGKVVQQHQTRQADVAGDHNVVRDGFESEVRAGDPTSKTSDAGQQNRWAELRKASASASNSTWDKIRQSHERSEKTLTNNAEQSQNGSEGSGVVDRRAEQAKFDALLEAERKASS